MNKMKAIANISWSFMAKIVAIVFVFVTDIVIARAMPINDYAAWTYFFSIKTMAVYICDLGMNVGAKIIISKSADSVQRRKILKNSLKVRMITAGAVSLLITLTSRWWITFFVDRSGAYGVIYSILPFIGFMVFSGAVMEFFKQIGYGIPDLKCTCIANILDYGLYFLSAAVMVFTVKSVFGLGVGYAFAGVSAVILSSIILNKKYNFIRCSISACEAKEYTHALIQNSIPLIAMTFANLMAMELDTIMLGILSSPEQAACYNIGKKVCSKAPHVNIAISSGIMTTFAVITKENAKLKLKEYKQYFILNLLVTLGVALCLILFAVWGIRIFYGEQYMDAKAVVICLLPYYVMFALKMYMSLFLDFQGNPMMRSIVMVISLMANAVINYFLIPYYGAMGAAISTLITEIPNFIYALGANISFWKKMEHK